MAKLHKAVKIIAFKPNSKHPAGARYPATPDSLTPRCRYRLMLLPASVGPEHATSRSRCCVTATTMLAVLIAVLLAPTAGAAAASSPPALVPRCFEWLPDTRTCLVCGAGEQRGACVRRNTMLKRSYLCSPKMDNGTTQGLMPWFAQLEQTAALVNVDGYMDILSGPYGDAPGCPIVASGRFREEACSVPAAVSGLLSAIPTSTDLAAFHRSVDCRRHCCSLSDMANGSFASPRGGKGDDLPVSHIWRTNSGCVPLSISPMHAIPCMHAQGVKRIVIIGDSILRQFTNRFISMARKRHTTVDMHTQWHSYRYRVWRDRDLLEIGSDWPQLDEGRRMQWARDLLHPDTRNRVRLAPGKCPPKDCHYGYDERFTNTSEAPEPLLDVVFLWSCFLEEQQAIWKLMHNLSDTHGERFAKTHVVTGVWQWYWKGGSFNRYVQQELMEEPVLSKFKEVLSLAAKPSPGIHTVYVANRHSGMLKASDPYLPHVQAINGFIDSWIHNTSNAVLLDLNAVSHASPIKAPQAKSGDIHYQCEYMNHYNQPREPCIRTNTHGGCTDTFNTMMVQLVLNHICNREMQGKPGSLA